MAPYVLDGTVMHEQQASGMRYGSVLHYLLLGQRAALRSTVESLVHQCCCPSGAVEYKGIFTNATVSGLLSQPPSFRRSGLRRAKETQRARRRGRGMWASGDRAPDLQSGGGLRGQTQRLTLERGRAEKRALALGEEVIGYQCPIIGWDCDYDGRLR